MPHDISLIATIAAAFGFAMCFGLAAARLGMPPLLGYLLAGVAIGPFTPGFVGDVGLAAQLAEIGVMLLMFGVGLHFSIDDLLRVRGIALPGAIIQILATVALSTLATRAWGWSLVPGLVFGLCLSVASTVVLLRALEARGLVHSVNGQIAVGWLVVEDLVMVLVLVLLPTLVQVYPEIVASPLTPVVAPAADAPATGVLGALTVVLAKVAAFVVFMTVVGKRVLPRVLWWIAQTGSRELFRLGVTAAAISVAFGAAKLFDVSLALGAFFAGMMLRESEFSQRAAEETLPLRDAFAVLFFVSVGMLFDPSILWQEPLKVLVVFGVIVFGKTLAAVLLVLALRYPLSTALTVGASLAQIGEFSFILAGLAVHLGLLQAQGQSLVLAGAVLSIAFNPALFRVIEPLRHGILARSSMARALEHRADALDELPLSTDRSVLEGQVVLVGYGRVGRLIGERLREAGIPFVVADASREVVESLRAEGPPAVAGDAGSADVLVQAHVAHAVMLVIAIDDPVVAQAAARTAKTLNPGIDVVVRTESEEEVALYAEEGLGTAFVPEIELAGRMADYVTAGHRGLAAGRPRKT